MNISKRLKYITNYVKDNSNIIDIACDHALLDIYLYYNKKNIDISISDIAKKPLEKAKDNLKKYNITTIKTYLDDGLNPITNQDTVIISGLGGKTITEIILKNPKKLLNIKNIILCPNDNFYLVRKIVTNQGYFIENEKMIEENNKTYLIISFVKGYCKYKKKELIFGKYVNKDLTFTKYYQRKLANLEYKLKSIPKKHFVKILKVIYEINILKRGLGDH